MDDIIKKIFKFLYKNEELKTTQIISTLLGLNIGSTSKIMEKGEEMGFFIANRMHDDEKMTEWHLTATGEVYWENKLTYPINEFKTNLRALYAFLEDNFDEFQTNIRVFEMHDKFKKATYEIYSDKLRLAKEFYGVQPVFYDCAKNFWMWRKDQACWERVDETEIINGINTLTGADTINSKQRNEIIEGIKQIGRRYEPLKPKETWIQFKKLIYDIKNDACFPANEKYFITNPIPWDMGSSDETPTMDKIFEDWVGKEYVDLIYEIIAYCLLPSYPIHRIFCFFGEGCNGKSKFFGLLRKFLGNRNCCTTDLDKIISSRFEVTRLHKKLVCQMGETDFNEIKQTAQLKSLVGGDLIGFEYKNKDPFEDINYAKILISTNNIPATSDKTHGFFRRWIIVDFFKKFTEEIDVLETIPEHEYNNLANKSIKILKTLVTKRAFTNEGDAELKKKRFEDKSNPLGRFWNENIEEEGSSYIFKYDFKKRLEGWLKENHFRDISETTTGRFMKSKNIITCFKVADWHTNEGNKPQLRAWSGIKWKG